MTRPIWQPLSAACLTWPGDLRDFLHADAALAGMAEAFAGEFQNHAAKSRAVQGLVRFQI